MKKVEEQREKIENKEEEETGGEWNRERRKRDGERIGSQ